MDAKGRTKMGLVESSSELRVHREHSAFCPNGEGFPVPRETILDAAESGVKEIVVEVDKDIYRFNITDYLSSDGYEHPRLGDVLCSPMSNATIEAVTVPEFMEDSVSVPEDATVETRPLSL